MSEEIHLTPEELERISKAVGNFGNKIQALVDIAKIPYMLMQAVDQMICEVCMFNEYCYMGMCMLTFVKEHHTIENVSIMPSNGNMQFTKQSIGND